MSRIEMDHAQALAILADDLGIDDVESLELLDPAYVVAYGRLSATARRRNALSILERELLMLALNASIHVYDPAGVELHARRAVAAGATPQQILSTKAESLGTHTITWSVPILLEELAHAGQPVTIPADDEMTDAEREVKERLIALRGWWLEGWRPMLRLDPDYLLATHELLATGQDVLEPRVRELIYMAFDVVTTHLYPSGARAHMRNALAMGVTADEILEVFELTALIGYQSLLLLLPAARAMDAPRVGTAARR